MVAYDLKIRTFQPSDTPAIHRIFTYGMTEPIPSGFRHAAKLPQSIALWSTGPLAAISTCAKILHNQNGGV
ncbi:Acetyltransferase (GNAT) domain, partial [Basidiobolus ranarum]